ncbi:hypothetical protein PI124_g17204 [Phytophthora idaei]|nr:hypothetical protein PI125_g13922 [Phytophthora idaei]KAG3146432.1 hypothetical protein PI126_g13328 [Phytophthora idaei]KAG3237817.1 hypothetical protein PI124_g17204 [Phytophthora idaei]
MTTPPPDSLTATVLADYGKDNNDIFVYKMPFKYSNVTGTMVITIDKSSLRKISDFMSSCDLSQVYDFIQLEKNAPGSENEERGLLTFAASHFAQHRLTQKVVSWFKSVF